MVLNTLEIHRSLIHVRYPDQNSCLPLKFSYIVKKFDLASSVTTKQEGALSDTHQDDRTSREPLIWLRRLQSMLKSVFLDQSCHARATGDSEDQLTVPSPRLSSPYIWMSGLQGCSPKLHLHRAWPRGEKPSRPSRSGLTSIVGRAK